MKHDELRSIAHNVADSFASGIGLLVGVYEMDVFGEAAVSSGGSLTIDFLRGGVIAGEASPNLIGAIQAYRDALPSLCARQGEEVAAFRELTVRFWSDMFDGQISVTVEDTTGRRSTTRYSGTPARRRRVLDPLGRLRPTPIERTDRIV